MDDLKTEQEVELDLVAQQKKRLTAWRHRKKPKSLQQLEQRIEEYFSVCGETGMIPSIEGLSLAIGVSRQTVLRWYRGEYCTDEWHRTVLAARQTILASAEQRMLNGSVHPAVGIFTMKALAGWRDDRPLEAEIDRVTIEAARPVTHMLTEYKQALGITDKSAEGLPDLPMEFRQPEVLPRTAYADKLPDDEYPEIYME